MTEPAFSEDEMEFISDEKIKKEVKDGMFPLSISILASLL